MEITYKLHDKQFQIFSDQTRFIVLAAGRRFGKTVLALVNIITKACQENRSRIFYIAPTYRQAEMIAWKMLFEMIPKGLIKSKNEVKLEITLINGSEISLKGAENEDSLRGVGLDYVILDEYASMKPNIWEEIIRPMLADRNGRAMFIGTPKGKNHFWELWMKGARKESDFSSYQMKTSDNPYIPRSEIKAAEETTNERYFRQEYEACFEDYVGLIYPEYTDKCLIDPIVIPSHWQTYCAIDTAITGTTACVFGAIDEDGCIYITSEYYEQDKRVSEVSASIKGRAGTYLIDPAAKHQSATYKEGRTFTLFDEFLEYGISAIPAENDVEGGINRVAEYFKSGKLKIFKSCVNLQHELERYHWSDEKETNSGVLRPKPYKALDHACDALRYLIMGRPSVSAILPKKVKVFSEKYFEDQEEKQSQYEELLNG